MSGRTGFGTWMAEAAGVDAVDGRPRCSRGFCERMIIMKTMRFLVAMAILAAVGVGVAGLAGAAEKSGRKPAAPAVEKAARKPAAKPVKKEQETKVPGTKVQKKAMGDAKLEVGKKPKVGKNTGAIKKAA